MILPGIHDLDRLTPQSATCAGVTCRPSVSDQRWAIGAVAILANWPYTLLVIKPTNDLLHGIAAEQSGAEARRMVVSWGALHAGRSALGIVAVLFYLWATLRH